MQNADPRFALAHDQARLAAQRLSQAAHLAALEHIVAALELAPGEASFWAQFADLAQYFSLRHPADPRLTRFLAQALEHPAVDPGALVRPIATLALSRPAAALFDDRLLLRLLELALARDPELERRIVAARAAALADVEGGSTLPLKALVAIAHQCFNTEYVFAEDAQEGESIERLGKALAAASSPPEHWYAVYACYRPLATLENAERIAGTLSGTSLSTLARRQILEPLEERRLATAIPSLTAVGGKVSARVQAQYEENPYPRWIRMQTAFATGSLAEILRELFPGGDLAGVPSGPASILVAGCGTGQNAIATARRFAASRVLAIDLSLASLAYALRKTLELGIGGIEYQRADILALGGLPQRFDMIESSGVLHHLADPAAGWRVLASLLRPRGLMRIGLYSAAGRRYLESAQSLIAREGLEAKPAGIRACRAAIRARGEDPQLARIARGEDFYSMSGCRDLLFHVQERCFTLPQIAAELQRLELDFIGFEFPDGGAAAARYRARYPADRTLTDLASWHQFEQEHPETFARMYQFWVRRRG